MYDELTSKERAILKKIVKVTDLESVELLSDWEDDHQVCIGVRVNGVEFGIWWTGTEVIGAFEYAMDSARAKIRVVDEIRDFIINGEEGLEEDN